MAKFKRNNLQLKTNQRILLGNSNDSQIRFDGANLLLNSSASIELYYAGIKVFETDSTGVNFIGTVTGDYFVGDGSLLTNLSVEAGSYISQGNSDVTVTDAGVGKVEITVDGTEMMEVTSTTMSLNYAGVKILETDATGIIVTGNITCDDLFTAGNTVYIGSDKKLDQDGLSYFDEGEWKISVRLATFGPAWMYYDGNKALSTGPNGAIVWHPTSNTPELSFQDNVGGLHQQLKGGTTDFTIKTHVHSGHIILEGDDAGGAVHTILDGNGDGALDLYYDGTKVLQTTTGGLRIDGANGAAFMVQTVNDTIIQNYITNGKVQIYGRDGIPASALMIECDPNGSVDLYYDAQLTTSTNAWGITLKDATFPSLGFELDGDTDTITYIYQNDTDWQFNCNMPGSNLVFRSITTGEAVKEMFKLDPDGDIEITSTDHIIIDAGDTGNGKYIENKWRNDGYYYTFHYLGSFYPSPTNALSLGQSGNVWKDVWATDTTINTSDERKKENIITSVLGLDFINELTPRSFKYKDYEGDELLPDGTSTVHVSNTYVRTHYGLIAQEVKQTMDSLGIDSTAFAGYIYDEENDFYGLRLGEFISPIIKAVQELGEDKEVHIVTEDSTAISGIVIVNSDTTATVELVASVNAKVTIKNVSTNEVTIQTSGTIDGQSSRTLSTQYESMTMVCDGTNWYII